MPIRFEPVTPSGRRLKVVRAIDDDRVRKVPFQTSAVDIVPPGLDCRVRIFVWRLAVLMLTSIQG